MNPVPQSFRNEIASFNRHCWLAALGSLFLAWLAWLLAYGITRGLALLVLTVSGGHDVILPFWLTPAFFSGALLLLIWAGVDSWFRRFRPPNDRPIIGWHLISDTLLLPARLTLAVGNHLDARIRLSRYELEETWRVLTLLASQGKTPSHTLPFDFPDQLTLRKALESLQALGWIDLHQGADHWFYLVRSNRIADLASGG